jgi:hypothetical protein
LKIYILSLLNWGILKMAAGFPITQAMEDGNETPITKDFMQLHNTSLSEL